VSERITGRWALDTRHWALRPAMAPIAIALAVLFAGCRADMPRLDDDPAIAGVKAKPLAETLALSAVEVVTRTADLAQDPTRCPAKVDRLRLRKGLAQAIVKYTGYRKVRLVPGEGLDEALGSAFDEGETILVRPVVERLDCVWKGYNGLWIPNIALWLYALVPSFWVADEDFGVEGELALHFYSVASGRHLYTRRIPIEGEYPLDDFERGFSFEGIVLAPQSMELEDWGTVAESLAPLVHHAAEREAVLEGRKGRATSRASRSAWTLATPSAGSRRASRARPSA